MGNIHLHTDLIAGLPFEGVSGYAESFNRVYSLGAEHFQGGFLKVLPGTEMYCKAGDYQMVYNPLPPYEIIQNRWITADEMERMKLVSELADLFHNSGKFPETEKFVLSLFSSPFSFYNRMSDFFRRENDARHRAWEYMAEIIFTVIKEDFPDSLLLLTDYLRWDWCNIMKHHHYPGILKSESTAEVKRKGYRFFLGLSENKAVNYKGFTFLMDDLRRSIYFSAETEEFIKHKMTGRMALFLPDKRIVFFDL